MKIVITCRRLTSDDIVSLDRRYRKFPSPLFLIGAFFIAFCAFEAILAVLNW